MLDWLTMDNIEELIDKYKLLGPLFGIFLTFIESYLPMLPLFVIVIANAGAYGLLWGRKAHTESEASYQVFQAAQLFLRPHTVPQNE